MNNALKLCLLATSSGSCSPTASSVKVEGGYMSAYGGVFCIRTPVNQEIGAAFNPRELATFFRKPRERVAYTLKFPKLTISEGNEKLTIKCLKADDMPIIDNIEPSVSCSLDLSMLKQAAEITDNSGPNYAHGVTFQDGSMLSTNNKAFFCGETDISGITIPKESALALCKFKSKVVAISQNSSYAKFIFEDGSSLCTHLLVTKFPNLNSLFDGNWKPISLKDCIRSLDCETIEIIGTELRYYTKDTVGILNDIVTGDVHFKVPKKFFDLLNGDIYFSEGKLKSIGDKRIIMCSTMNLL